MLQVQNLEVKQLGMNPQKVVVFGANGFLGEHIVKSLLAASFEVRAAVRKKKDASQDDFADRQVNYCEGDLENCDYIRQVLEGMDAVIFSAGCIWQPELAVAEYYRRNVQITENFFHALGDRPQMRVVYTSSMSTIAGSRTPFSFTENCGRDQVSENSLSPYDLAKIQCEQLALESAGRGNNVVILNPGNMLGPGAFRHSHISTTMLVLWFCQKNFPFFVNGGHSYCDVRDVAKAHVAALALGQKGGRYIIAGENLSMAQISQLMVRTTNLAGPRELPLAAIYLLSLLLESLSFLTGGLFKNPYHPAFVKSFSLYYFANSQKAINQLDYCITPIETTLLDTIKHFLACGLLSDDLRFVEALNPDNIQQFLCLHKLAKSHPFAQFLLVRIPEIDRICMTNTNLKQVLTRVQNHSKFDATTGHLQLNKSKCKDDLKVLQKLFEYLYFASNDFLSKVM